MKKIIYLIIPALVIIVLLLIIVITPNKEKSNFQPENPFLGDAPVYYNSNRVSYNNTNSGLSANTVQSAIEELYNGIVGDCYVGYTKGDATSTEYRCNKNSSAASVQTDFNANNVKYNNSSGVIANNIQAAIDEIASYASYCADGYYKTNETSTSYDCYTMCHDMVEKNVTYGSYKSCTASCPTTTGRQYRDVYHHMYSSYDEDYYC